MHVIGEDTAERLNKIPTQYQVIVTHRPKYGCRACEGAIVQAPAAERLIKSGIPTENLVGDVVLDKYAWHKPLYRQAQVMRLQGLLVELAGWLGWRRHATLLAGYSGIVHCDGYTVYKQLADPQRDGGR
jgi:transposase